MQQLLNYSDPDHTISTSVTDEGDEFLNAIPTKTDSALDRRKLIKYSITLPIQNTETHKIFFRMLFNEPTEIYKPTEDMLKDQT